MNKEPLRKEVSEILKSVVWMWEPKEKDYLPDSCNKDVDAIIKLFATYTLQQNKSLIKKAVHYTPDKLADGLDPWAIPVAALSDTKEESWKA